MEDKEFKRIHLVILIGIIFILVAPFILSRSWGIISFDKTSGEVGDTIGGITAPIASLLGSILVYYALRAQIKANRIITDQFNEQKNEDSYRQKRTYIEEQINLLRDDIYSYFITLSSVNYTGTEAIFIALKVYRSDTDDLIKEHCILQLESILDRITYILENITEIELEQDKDYLKSILFFTYDSKLSFPLAVHENRRGSKLNTVYALPESLYEKYDIINSQLYDPEDEENEPLTM